MHSLTLLSGTYQDLHENGISYPNLSVKFIVLLIFGKNFCLLLIVSCFTLEERMIIIGIV